MRTEDVLFRTLPPIEWQHDSLPTGRVSGDESTVLSIGSDAVKIGTNVRDAVFEVYYAPGTFIDSPIKAGFVLEAGQDPAAGSTIFDMRLLPALSIRYGKNALKIEICSIGNQMDCRNPLKLGGNSYIFDDMNRDKESRESV